MRTQVLDVGTHQSSSLEESAEAPIKLVESREISRNRTYVCLSHRWSATERTIVTEQATYERHRSAIAFQDLGVVFQDVVHILRRLGVRYVWIDSLCIIQDLVEDWRTESNTMARVYSHGLFTLARHSGHSKPKSHMRLEARSYLVSEPLASPLVYAQGCIPHIWHKWDIKENFPLQQRGWVYQERFLSQRVAHFTDREIAWNVEKCRHASATRDSTRTSTGGPHAPSYAMFRHWLVVVNRPI
jgi:hypothetical protein